MTTEGNPHETAQRPFLPDEKVTAGGTTPTAFTGEREVNQTAMMEALMKGLLMKGLSVHENLSQDVVLTTTDRLKLALLEHQKALYARSGWIAPVSVFLSLLAAIVAADFKDALGISKDQWRSGFLLALVLCGFWLAHSLIQVLRNWTKGDIDKLVEKIKRK